ncbi:hypothetical protein ABZ260_05670 [Streptosporangium sp. NPDC006013]|uniref:hypothetical protein n=1 Tax=Streptosporangium sp. NPDC006013 TaxID=3155596 RepID=UPI00339EDE3F
MDGGRRATRTADYHAPEFHRGEQLVIYRSAGAARRAMAGLLAQVDRCKRVKSGSVVFKASARGEGGTRVRTTTGAAAVRS